MNDEQQNTLPYLEFDRELNISDLLNNIDKDKLYNNLRKLLNEPFNLSDLNENIIFGDVISDAANQYVVRYEIEPVAYLNSHIPVEKLQAAGNLVDLLLQNSARYIMTSNIHLEAIQSDYKELARKHEALITSETRYKELASHLEERVEEQVKVINNSQRQLYQAEKMASVGQLAAGVAHEINNPMGFINSNLSTASGYVKELKELANTIKNSSDINDITNAWMENNTDFVLDDFESLISESIDGAERVTAIVKNLKDFSNVDKGEEQLANINDIITSTVNMSQTEISKNAKLELQLGEIPNVLCQPGYLGQVFLNIILNSLNAVEKNGQIRVKTFLQGDQVIIEISDNGPGIPQDKINKIFDPFYTTQPVGKGTGLGLTVSRDIVMAHNGDINVESANSIGTTMRISLPVDKE